MIVLKLIKDIRELYVTKDDISHSLAIKNKWTITEVSVANDKILNNQTDIN